MGGYTGKWIEKWHKDYQPDPHPQIGDIYSGLRAPLSAPAESRAKDVTSPCQYWVKGLPGVCSHFSGDKCGAGRDANGKYPTGYNGGKCDYLGRRNWCSCYESGAEDLEEYVCIAPDMFRTGLGKRDTSVTTHLLLIPYSKSEILGYNPDGNDVGRCDGLGMGRGSGGNGITDPEEMYKLPVVCRHYKPWLMGFGAIKPRPLGTAVLEGKNIYDGSVADPLTGVGRYLPFMFRVLNLRADHQKCAYWDQDFGTHFEMDYSGGYASISLPVDPLTECTCADALATPYKTITDEWLPNTSDTLQYVLTKEKGIVCNGAHSECPCYTGKWYYCIADNMRDGMRITAEQVLELRFWMAVWQTQEMYDSVFAEKPGPSGLITSDIFTFDKWEKLGGAVEDSIMKGKRIRQCFPIPLNQRAFDPDVYLEKKVITYPKATVRTGTPIPEESPFPTLVRTIDDCFIPPLDVIYPYFCKDPWDVIPCEPISIINTEIASCKLEPPATAIFGYTVRNKEVYAINTNKINGIDVNKFKKTPITILFRKEKDGVNDTIRRIIKEALEDGNSHKYIAKGVSNEYGYFGIGPLTLEYNTTISIAIICEWQPGEYEIVIRDVNTKLYGACIVQDDFKSEYKSAEGSDSVYVVTLPASFSPPAKLSGHVQSLGGNVHSIFPVYNKHTYGTYGLTQNKVEYSYCVNEYTEDVYTSKWIQIGPTGYIWAEIDNVDLSYLFDFEVVSAKISFCGEEGETVCDCGGDGESRMIELDVVFPKVGNPDAIKRDHIPPNCVLLKSSNPRGFSNEDWSLYIEYKYKLLETHKAKVFWPDTLDGAGSSNKFVKAPFSLEVNNTMFKVENIETGTIAIMAYIEDDDSRVQSAVATKMLCDVVTTGCRSVEIFYRYIADATGYNLQPNSGFFNWRGANKVVDGDMLHFRTPHCGDHDLSPRTHKGPMWFPFNACCSTDYYDVYTGPNWCTMPIEGSPRQDFRYSTVESYQAWAEASGYWIYDCINGWSYFFSVAGDSRFYGYAKIRTSVDPIRYSVMGWSMPPFGNAGREITERWLSQEHYGFWDMSGSQPVSRSEYMPLVFDDEMLFTSFNAFDEKGCIGSVDDYFHTTCMLNCMLSNVINETLTEDRYRFEDLFRVINHAWCMYPPPVYKGPTISLTARRYSFKVEDVAWAWREYWKDVERNIDDVDVLNFVDLSRPEYYFDYEKAEHRLITDEREVQVFFVAPILGEESEESEEGDYIYSEISIRGGVPRKFKIIYDLYDSEQVEWMDEGGDGTEGSSGGEEEKSIYEVAMGDDWFHDENIIFDGNASADKSDDRKIVLSKDTCAWYNRGLIANILKDRLIYLPYTEVNAGRDLFPDIPPDNGFTWYGKGPFSIDVVFPYTGGGCVTKIIIEGSMGISNAEIYDQPQITVAECSVDDDPSCHLLDFPSTVLYRSKGEKGDGYSDLQSYSIVIELTRFPKRMLYPSLMLKIKLTVSSGRSLKLLGSPIIFVGFYRDAVESIKVWEQRYITSTGDFGDKNPDGPDSFYLRSYDRNLKNAGQYFPVGYNAGSSVGSSTNGSGDGGNVEFGGGGGGEFGGGGVTGGWDIVGGGGASIPGSEMLCLDKMTMIGAGEQYIKDVDLSVSKGNLKAIERGEQQELYDNAYFRDSYDDITYSIILPPNIQQFFEENGIYSNLSGNCNFISEKLPWDKHYIVTLLNQDGNFWQPGGHFYGWSGQAVVLDCWLFPGQPLETIYSVSFAHLGHGSGSFVAERGVSAAGCGVEFGGGGGGEFGGGGVTGGWDIVGGGDVNIPGSGDTATIGWESPMGVRWVYTGWAKYYYYMGMLDHGIGRKRIVGHDWASLHTFSVYGE